MSLKFILGGSRTGKSSRLYEMVIRRSLEDPDARLLLIVPEQYTLQTQKKIVSLHPSHAVMNIDVLSFERLAYRVFDETGTSTREILDDTGKSMIIRRILEEKKEELHAFAGSIRKRGFTDQVRSMISELIQYDISPDILRGRMPSPGASPRLHSKLKDINIIYESFLDFINDRYMTSEEILGVLSDVISRSENIRHSEIFMDNFTGFTPLQYRLMRRLLVLCPSVTMTLCADADDNPYDHSDRDDLFYITRDTISRLNDICVNDHVPRGEDILLRRRNVSEGREDLYMLEKSIFRDRSEIFGGVPENIVLRRCASPDEEMYIAARNIHDLVRGGNLRYSQIAVVTGDMETYLPAARRWFKRYDIPCFFDTRRSISSNMLIEWLRALLDLLRREFRYESVFRFLRSGLGPLDRNETDELENYVLAYGIRGKRRWTRPFDKGEKELGSEKLKLLNTYRERFTGSIQPLVKMSGSGKYSVSDMVRGIYMCMESSHIHSLIDKRRELFDERGDLERAREYDQIFDVVTGILERIYMILGDEKMSLREFSDVIESGISQIKLGIIPPGIDQLTFGDLRRTRLDDIKILFFAGLNDSVVPQVSHPAGLISDAEREVLSRCGIELAPTAADNLRTERFYLYSCMTKPADGLIISYAASAPDGTEMLPSRLISRIRKIFPSLNEKNSDEGMPADVRSGYEAVKNTLSGISGGMQGASGARDDKFPDLYRWFVRNPLYHSRMEKLTDAACGVYTGDRLSRMASDAIYSGQLRGGVTMLERYASCAYSHFLTYGLGLSQRKLYQVEAPDIGLIFHEAIERFSRRLSQSGMGWRDIPDRLRDEWIDASVRSVCADYGSNLMQDTGRSRFMTEWLCGTARRTAWALQQQIRKGDFDPEEYEFSFSEMIGEDMPDGRVPDSGLILHGKIDRVDVCEDGGNTFLRIIDYKTGKNKFSLSSVYYGLSLQLMVYMNAACDAAARTRGGIIIPSGVFYYNVGDPLIDTQNFKEFSTGTEKDLRGKTGEDDFSAYESRKNHGSEEETGEDVMKYTQDEIAALESLSMEGLVVDDGDIIRHNDNMPGERPKIIPLRLTPKGALDRRYTSAAAPDDFSLLRRYVDKKCLSLGKEILSGEISVRPYTDGNKTACEYCPYRAVCGFSAGIPGYHYRKLRSMKNDEIWALIAREISGAGRGGEEDGD